VIGLASDDVAVAAAVAGGRDGLLPQVRSAPQAHRPAARRRRGARSDGPRRAGAAADPAPRA
jgi:hypothetical protein